MECERAKKVRAKRVRHTERVSALCEELAAHFEDGEVDQQLLLEAAWLHDVAKDYDDDTHHTPETVRAVIGEYTLDVDFDDISAIIAQHKGKKFSPVKYELESAILCICDKIDKMNKAKEKADRDKVKKKEHKAREKCEESLMLIECSGRLSSSTCDIIRQFCTAKLDELESGS